MKFLDNQGALGPDDLEREQFSIDVLMGLSSEPKRIPAKYFYDDRGSELFQQITKQADYYPTRAEFSILEGLGSAFAKDVKSPVVDIIELGSGDGHKSKILIQTLLDAKKKLTYYPIDISEKAMGLLEDHLPQHENLKTIGVVGEYFDGIQRVVQDSKNQRLVLFLGSNIGNFSPVQSQGFLRRLWKSLNHGDQVFIGFDLKKDIDTLIRAYNDSGKVTREFNLNLLSRMNSELGANFSRDHFRHFATYNPTLGAMESYLISTKDQEVKVESLERKFHFKAYEPMHLEYSFKFLKSDINTLAANTGFEVLKHYTDENHYFVDSLWSVKKQ